MWVCGFGDGDGRRGQVCRGKGEWRGLCEEVKFVSTPLGARRPPPHPGKALIPRPSSSHRPQGAPLPFTTPTLCRSPPQPASLLPPHPSSPKSPTGVGDDFSGVSAAVPPRATSLLLHSGTPPSSAARLLYKSCSFSRPPKCRVSCFPPARLNRRVVCAHVRCWTRRRVNVVSPPPAAGKGTLPPSRGLAHDPLCPPQT